MVGEFIFGIIAWFPATGFGHGALEAAARAPIGMVSADVDHSGPVVRPHGIVMTGRYEVFGPEAEFEPGSRGRALRNRLGITSVRALQQRESEALLATTQQVIDHVTVDQNFTAADVCRLHHLWLGEIYEWAGEYRSVNIAKGEFMFAAAAQVPQLMQQLEQGPLRLYTPCRIKSTEQQAAALAIVHAEFVLIHPFREGNGRCARLLAMLMGLQAGLPALDFGGIRGAKKRRYIAAVHSAMDRNYAPMTRDIPGSHSKDAEIGG